jgi:hypothetical protein
MVGVTRGDFQAARSHAHHEQGEFDEHFDNTVMLNSLAKHSMSPLKVQMTALKRGQLRTHVCCEQGGPGKGCLRGVM